ncbi:MAG: beta-ketoacyl synthase chain length factor [Elusimicrobiaceae bacterium]|nr:beta-ketoacyl synthase chain length factor [Elusimicrobiaceae bacterium]
MPQLYWGLAMLPKLYINGFSCLTGDAQAEDFAPFMEVRKLRRAEQISKNVLLCAFRTLEQAHLKDVPHTDLAISLAMGAGALESTIKFMDSIIEDGDELSSPTAFASSVHNSTALFLSMFLGIHGPCVVTGQLDASFAGALLTAQQFLAKGMCKHVLVALAEDVNPLLTEQLQKDSSLFDPFMYQPQSPAERVAGALMVSAHPMQATQFVLDSVQLRCTDDVATQSQPQLPVRSCAHSVLLLDKYLQQNAPFTMHEQFAGTILNIEGMPYVFS